MYYSIKKCIIKYGDSLSDNIDHAIFRYIVDNLGIDFEINMTHNLCNALNIEINV